MTINFWQEVQQNDGRKSKGSPFFSNKQLKKHLAVPKHDVLAILLKHSDQCLHSIG